MAVTLRFAIIAALVYAVVPAGTYLFQSALHYQPRQANPTPQARGLTGVQVVPLITPDDVQLVLWYAPAANGRPTLLFFHGNAGEMADRAGRSAFYQSQGFGAAFLSYRGFGGSQGQVTEASLITDAHTACDWLRSKGSAARQIVLVAESLGTGAAVQLAAQVPVSAVALTAPCASTLSVAQGRFPFLPVRWLMKDQFRSTNHIARINAPLLIQHGTADMVIPYRSGQTLYTAALQPKIFLPHPCRSHNVIVPPTALAAETDFITRTLP